MAHAHPVAFLDHALPLPGARVVQLIGKRGEILLFVFRHRLRNGAARRGGVGGGDPLQRALRRDDAPGSIRELALVQGIQRKRDPGLGVRPMPETQHRQDHCAANHAGCANADS